MLRNPVMTPDQGLPITRKLIINKKGNNPKHKRIQNIKILFTVPAYKSPHDRSFLSLHQSDSFQTILSLTFKPSMIIVKYPILVKFRIKIRSVPIPIQKGRDTNVPQPIYRPDTINSSICLINMISCNYSALRRAISFCRYSKLALASASFLANSLAAFSGF